MTLESGPTPAQVARRNWWFGVLLGLLAVAVIALILWAVAFTKRPPPVT